MGKLEKLYINFTITVPIESNIENKEMNGEYNKIFVKLKPSTKRLSKFIKKLGKLCKKYGQNIEITENKE